MQLQKIIQRVEYEDIPNEIAEILTKEALKRQKENPAFARKKWHWQLEDIYREMFPNPDDDEDVMDWYILP